MKSIGIITIHKINNYGSVLQAYALQKVCEEMGFKAEIIDYKFPNEFHSPNKYVCAQNIQPNEPVWIKLIYGWELMKQHKGVEMFVKKYQHLSLKEYLSPVELKMSLLLMIFISLVAINFGIHTIVMVTQHFCCILPLTMH